MNTALVDIHIPALKVPTPTPEGVHFDDRLNTWGRATLADALLAEGVDVTFSRGATAYDFEAGTVRALHLRGLEPGADKHTYKVSVEPEEVAIDSVAAVRNVTGVLGNDVPELNHGELRAVTRDKDTTNRVLGTVDLAKQYVTLGVGESLDEKLQQLAAEAVVVKPRTGKQGIGVELTTKTELVRKLREGSLGLEKDVIIEERLNMNVPMPVRGINDAEQAKIDAANRDGAAKELRAYYFGDNPDGSPRLHYVLRVAQKGMDHLHHDEWVYVDQDSVPSELYGMSATVAGALKQASKNKEIHIGIDWVRAEKNGAEYWVPMEVNGGEPQLVYENQHRPTAKVHATLLAQQLSRVAQAATTRYTKEQTI